MSSNQPAPPASGKTLSEEASKTLLSGYGVPFPTEHVVADPEAAASAADQIGYPVVAKLNGDAIAHKTERGLVKLGLRDADAVRAAATELFAAATSDDGVVSVLVAPLIRSNREFICGISQDPQFGPTVLLGVGGILAEAIADVVIRLVPLDRGDALDMIAELRTQALLEPFRGEPAIDREALADLIMALSATAEARPDLVAVDLNPVLINDGKPFAVDALVEIQSNEPQTTGLPS